MRVFESLATLEELGLVRRAADDDWTYLFKHILTQEAVYASLLRPDRRTLHRLICGIFQELHAGEIDEYLPLLARHYQEAGDNAQACEFLIRYAEYAKRLSAFPEAVAALERALALLDPEEFGARARVLARLGDLYCRLAEYEAANRTLDASLADAGRAGDAGALSTAWTGLARVANQQGDHRRAHELGERALDQAQVCGQKDAIARAHRQLGISYNLVGENGLANKHLHAALALFRELNDSEGIGSALNSLGVVAREEKDLTGAWAFLQQALAIGQERGDKYSTGVRLTNLSVIAEEQGDLETAARYQEQAHAIALEIGDREGAALTELNLGSLALTRGESTRARDHFHSALVELMTIQAVPYALYAVAAIAKWEASVGHYVRAAELYGLAVGHTSSTADIAVDFEPLLRDLQNELGRGDLEVAMQRGKSRPLGNLVQEIIASQNEA